MVEMVPAAMLTCINGASGKEYRGMTTMTRMTGMLPSLPIGWGTSRQEVTADKSQEWQ